jgi:hypothetical protein
VGKRILRYGYSWTVPVGLSISAMPTGRMSCEQFFGQLVTFDEQRLKKALWNLYWRGSAATRERIEAEIDPEQNDRGKRPFEGTR